MNTSLRQSELFTRTKKETPTDEVSKNAELLIRGGVVYKKKAGGEPHLPPGPKKAPQKKKKSAKKNRKNCEREKEQGGRAGDTHVRVPAQRKLGEDRTLEQSRCTIQ